jgi:hypothetical protein
MKKAALPVGGWEGYKPLVFRDVAVGLLEAERFEVASYRAPTPLADPMGSRTSI